MGYIGNGPYQGVLTGGNIQDGTVETTDLADGAVTTAKINDGAVTAGKLAAGAAVPDQTGQSGKFLTTDGTTASWATITVDDEIAIGATAPSSPTEGQVWYDTGLDILKAYDGTNWNKVSPVIPTIVSISGTIYEGIGGNITITGTGFLSGECSVEFSGGFTTTSVNATASSDTSLVVAVPSAVYASSGTVNLAITNDDNGKSPSSTFNVLGLPTGGTITSSGGYRYHTFTSSSSFVVPSGFSATAEYLVVAGGAGGGGTGVNGGGGGGAGGYIAGSTSLTSGTYTATVGGAGSGGSTGSDGGNSAVLGVTAIGGGGGGGNTPTSYPARSGGSGGGVGRDGGSAAPGSGTSGQGNRGGYAGGATCASAGGGGGAGGVGYNGETDCNSSFSNANSAAGGPGLQWLNGTYYAGGGGGAYEGAPRRPYGGIGGGGEGGSGTGSTLWTPTSGATNTGGGGGGGQNSRAAGSGGSGIVIIRYAI
jgi:hypothetical protein